MRLLDQITSRLYERDRPRLLYEWLQGLPDHVFERSPHLAYLLAFAMVRIGRVQEAESPLRFAEEAWILAGDRANLGLVRTLHAHMSFWTAETGRVIDYARQALDLLPEDRPDERGMALLWLGGGYCYSGDCANAEATLARARATLDRGRHLPLLLTEMAFSCAVLVQRGKLLDATVLLRRVGTLADPLSAIQYQHALYRLSDVYVEWSLIDDAERMLQRADALGAQMQSVIWRSWICLGLARVAWARGDTEAAFDELDRAVEFAGRMGWKQGVRTARAQQARFWLAAGQIALARHWAESCDLDPYLPPTYERQFEHLTFVRLLIAEDRPAVALRLLEAIAAHAVTQCRDGDLVEITVLQALSHKADGDQAAAVAALDSALALGEPGGYVRTFANEGEAFAPLLRHAATRGNHRDYAKLLLNAIEGDAAPAVVSQADTLDALSDREVEVLRLVATGLPNRDVGQRLFISEKTVKKHLSNILGKLGATNRTQAVDQARRLGLV